MKKDNFADQIEHFMSGAEDIVTLHRETAGGFMNLTAYYILPGIFLMLNDIHTPSVPVDKEAMPQDFLLINYCMQGRCEFKIDENNYSYIDMNLMNIASKMVQDCFAYPSSFYVGYEIYVLPSMFTDSTRDALRLFHVDPVTLIQRYPQGIAFYAPDPVVRLWNHISESGASGNIGQIRLDTLQLLKYFCDQKPFTPTNTLYLSKVQVMLARKAKEMLTEDLSSSSVHEGRLGGTGYQRDQPEKIFPIGIRRECICLPERGTDEVCCRTPLLLEGQHLGNCEVLRLCESGALCKRLPGILRDEAAGL